MVNATQHLVLATIEEGARALSLRVLGAYAESLGVRTTLLRIIKPLATIGHPVTFSAREVATIARFLEEEEVTHLGFYLMTATLKPYRLLVRALRDAGFGGVVMAGGVHASLCPEESLVDGADYAVRGPGELALEAILAAEEPVSIPGLVWRENGELRVNAQSAEQRIDLDSIPYQLLRFDQDKVLLEGKLRPYTRKVHDRFAGWGGRQYDMMTSRGCPNRCTYCCNVDRTETCRQSVDRVIGELRHLREQHPWIEGVNFQDDIFFAGPREWLDEFCRRMPAEVGLPFIVRMIPRLVTRERVEQLKAGGCHYVTMGLQGSDRINRSLYLRQENRRSFLTAAQIILRAGLYLSIDVIVHNPYETEEDLREVAETLNALPRPNWGVVTLALTPFPRTELHRRLEEDGLLERVAADPYDSMLLASRPGAYLTPRFWLLVMKTLLPVVSPEVGARLIALDPSRPENVASAENLARRVLRAKRASAWLRKRAPWLYRRLERAQRRMAK